MQLGSTKTDFRREQVNTSIRYLGRAIINGGKYHYSLENHWKAAEEVKGSPDGIIQTG